MHAPMSGCCECSPKGLLFNVSSLVRLDQPIRHCILQAESWGSAAQVQHQRSSSPVEKLRLHYDGTHANNAGVHIWGASACLQSHDLATRTPHFDNARANLTVSVEGLRKASTGDIAFAFTRARIDVAT